MSQTSARFNLPYIMPGQAQKHVTHNEAVRALDALLHISVLSRAVDSPPAAPSEGNSYLISRVPTGVFEGYAQSLAYFIDSAWMIYPPVQGLIVNVEDEAICLIWRGSEWTELGTGDGIVDISTLTFETFGINAAADTFNRLVLNSDASLFNHNGAGHQLKINKAAAADTASLLFQDNFSGRAEMGLVADDNFAVKVSADGTDFKYAITVDGASGEVSFPNSPHLIQPVIFNMFGDGGRFGGKPEPLNVRLGDSFVRPNYINGYNGAVLSQGNKYIDNSNNFGGGRGVMPDAMVALIKRFKPGAAAARLRNGTEFYTIDVAAGSGQNGGLTVNEATAYLAIAGLRFPITPRFTLSYWVRVTSGECFVGDHSHTRLLVDGIERSGNVVLNSNGIWHHIERVVSYSPEDFIGYEINLYRIYAAAGSTFEIAAPVLFPGNLMTNPDLPTGIVNSLTAFM